MSFSLNKPLNSLISTDSSFFKKDKKNYSTQNPSSNESVEDSEDNWDDDDFFQQEEVTENSNISMPYSISLGIEEKQILHDVFRKNNLELKEDEFLKIKNTFLIYKKDVLHLSNNLQLLESFHKDEAKPSLKIKESHFQNPVYMELDFQSILMAYFPKTILENIDEKKNLRQTLSNIILTSYKDGFHVEFGLKQKDKNSIQVILEAILENKTLDNYL